MENTWIGKKIKQISAEAPAFRGMIGRMGTVDDSFVDEYDQTHIRTIEDGVWCPARLVKVIG